MMVSIDVELTRTELEALILPLVERTLEICQDAIKYSDYPQDSIDLVLLVGGSAQIPLVQNLVGAKFGAERVAVHPRPMYAVAEGAAIVAAGLTEKVSTVSRNYCIELTDNERFVLVKQGEILPLLKTHTFKTVADGQRLLHFKFFSPDEVRSERERQQHDELIGEMWLVLDRHYPKGTEVLLTSELDELHNSIQMTAALKNEPEIRTSCSFSRGGSDEKISRQVEQVIEELNTLDLTTYGVEQANRLAADVVKSVEQVQRGGDRYQDRMEVARSQLLELKLLASQDIQSARYFVNAFKWVLEYCTHDLYELQIQRIEEIVEKLSKLLDIKDLPGIEASLPEARQEYDNLADTIKAALYCRDGISNVAQIAPVHARSMSIKFERLAIALKHNDRQEIDRLLGELITEIGGYLNNEESSKYSISTGLSK